MSPFFLTTLKVLGGLSAISISIRIARFFHIYLIQSSLLLRYQHGKPRSTWALVTGSTDGIGLGFAKALGNRGFNILLHGRSPEKLARVRESLLESQLGIGMEIIVADALDCDKTGEGNSISHIREAVENLLGKLTVLVNNVGGSPLPPSFALVDSIDANYRDSLINLNARFPTQLTKALLPLLSANQPSLVLNMTSAAALCGLPYFGIYSASKAFNYTFSEALGVEMKATGRDVEILGIVVEIVSSAGNRTYIRGIMCDSEHLARVALERVGCGQWNVWAWYRHALQYAITDLVPNRFTDLRLAKAMKLRKIIDEKQD